MSKFTNLLKQSFFAVLSIASASKNSGYREKSNKQYLKDSNINKVKPDKFGTVRDPFEGKDYADYKMPRERKSKK